MNSPNNLLDETLFVRNYGHARLSSSRRTWRETVSFRLRRLGIRVQEIWESMNTPQRILTVFVLLVLFVLGIIFLIISKNIIHWLIPMAEQWESSTFVCFIVWALTFTVSFPPLIGWGLLGSISGFLFGLWKGWLVFASGTVIGSATSIIVCRTVLSGYVHRLVQHDHRFKALAATIKTDGLKLLCLIRLCPLPYSICNGAMSTFPSVSPLTYGLATMVVSPKLLLITFIGSRLRILSESGEKMSLAAKIVNVFSILLTCLVGAGTGLYIYRNMNLDEAAQDRDAEYGPVPRRGSLEEDQRFRAFRDDDYDEVSLPPVDTYRDTTPDDHSDVFAVGDGFSSDTGHSGSNDRRRTSK